MNIFKAWVEISRLDGRIAAVSGIHTENSPCFHQFARHKMFPFSTCPECPCLHRTGHLSPCQLRLVLGSQTNAFWEAQPRCCLAGSASQCCHFGHWIVPCTQRSRAHLWPQAWGWCHALAKRKLSRLCVCNHLSLFFKLQLCLLMG